MFTAVYGRAGRPLVVDTALINDVLFVYERICVQTVCKQLPEDHSVLNPCRDNDVILVVAVVVRAVVAVVIIKARLLSKF